MKHFDLVKAKAGAAVCTTQGRPARIICFDRNPGAMGNPPLVALLTMDNGNEILYAYEEDGDTHAGTEGLRLVMATIIKSGWINVHSNGRSSWIHDSKGLAENTAGAGVIDTIYIEWEE